MENKEEKEKLKKGFTTGSAATAATKAALFMLLSKEETDSVKILTPAGIEYVAKIEDIFISENFSTCSIKKDSGDDPDVTNGIKIFSKVSFTDEAGVHIVGGEGIGIVTRPGLDQAAGEYAINSTPRKMIENVVTELLDDFDVRSGVLVEISAPEGKEIALKTFNPRMGIEGGISIIGTTGIVEPMSTKALVDTIQLDINMQYAEGKEKCIIVPGNYGVTFLNEKYNIDSSDIVLCSNYVGDSIKMALECGFKKILFCSHIGKMIKVSGGIMNTHSSFGDYRMELMCEAYKQACKESDICQDNKIIDSIMNCVSTTAALDILDEIDMVKPVSKVIVEKSLMHLKALSQENFEIECLLYENNYGELAGVIG